MTTIREYVTSFGNKYIWGLSDRDDTPSKSKVVRIGTDAKNLNKDLNKGIDLELLRKIVISEPLVRKAIFKKNRDTFKNWFDIKDKNGDNPPQSILDMIDSFNKKTQFPALLYKAGICANIYGTGFIEKIYNEHGNTRASSDPSGKTLIDLELLNSEKIKERKKYKDTGKLLYPVYSKGRLSEDIYIHPRRLEVVKIDSLPFSYFGISIPKVLWNILGSKMNADKSSGEILNWFGRGMYDITIEGMTDEDEKHASKQVKNHPDYLLHDEKTKVDIVNPTRVDPAPFYDYFYTNIAAALEMPKHMLTGSQMGDVTGSEVGTSAYYSDIENIQKLVFTPIIENIYEELLKSNGRTWKYSIEWNPIFVDELSEAKILQTRSYSATQAYATGIIDQSEARDMLNVGIVDLDTGKTISDRNEEKPVDPNIEPQPTIKPQHDETSFTPYLTKSQKEMIEKLKLKGKIEAEMQEKRIKEAMGR